MEQPENCAIPPVVISVHPERTPAPGLAPKASDTVLVFPVTVFPPRSWIVTRGCGPNSRHPARWRRGEGELGSRTDRDVERGAIGGRRQVVGDICRRQRVVVAGRVDLAAAELGDAVHGRAGAPRQRPVAGVRPDGQRDRVAVSRDDVARGVFDPHRWIRGKRRPPSPLPGSTSKTNFAGTPTLIVKGSPCGDVRPSVGSVATRIYRRVETAVREARLALAEVGSRLAQGSRRQPGTSRGSIIVDRQVDG